MRNFRTKPINTDNGVTGPTYLEDYTVHIDNPKDLESHEWRRKLKALNGETKFRVKYYGDLHEDYPNLIVGTGFAPSLIFAVDITDNSEILLFDGCQHGYNAMFCDTYTQEELKNRPTDNIYKDAEGNEVFEITISTYNGIDLEEDFGEEVDENGEIELVNGRRVHFETAKRNGFDTIQIWATNNQGKTTTIVEEELA